MGKKRKIEKIHIKLKSPLFINIKWITVILLNSFKKHLLKKKIFITISNNNIKQRRKIRKNKPKNKVVSQDSKVKIVTFSVQKIMKVTKELIRELVTQDLDSLKTKILKDSVQRPKIVMKIKEKTMNNLIFLHQ